MPTFIPASPGLVDLARRLGPLPYSELVPPPAPAALPVTDLALWVAALIDDLWHRAGEPDPFFYVEVGAGDGSRVKEILRLGPECLEALRVVAVEEDSSDREEGHRSNLSIESPALILGPVVPGEDPEEGPAPPARIGPLVTSLAELPVLDPSWPGVVAAFERVSRMPSDRFEWREGSWWEVRLAAVASQEGVLAELAVPLDKERAAVISRLVADPRHGGRYAWLVGARAWIREALRAASGAWLVVVDRWAEQSLPLREGGRPPLALDQLSAVALPEAGPYPLGGGLFAVRWPPGAASC